jgi:hypothetical protein
VEEYDPGLGNHVTSSRNVFGTGELVAGPRTRPAILARLGRTNALPGE